MSNGLAVKPERGLHVIHSPEMGGNLERNKRRGDEKLHPNFQRKSHYPLLHRRVHFKADTQAAWSAYKCTQQ